MDPVALVNGLGGIATRRELIAAGVTDRLLRSHVQEGILRQPARGSYSSLPRQDPRFRATVLGGLVTGASAMDLMGAWLPAHPKVLHVAVPPSTGRRPHVAGVRFHWGDQRQGARGVASLVDSLARVVLDEDLETSVCCLDWALSTGRLDRIDFESIWLRLPRSAHSVAEWVDPRSQSILESVARVRLCRRGWRVRSQVRVGELQSIDLVVEDAIALELDGRRFHESTFSTDRRKDLQITIEGRHAIRLDAPLLFGAWSLVEEAIAAALAARGRGVVDNLGANADVARGERLKRGVATRLRPSC